jgi:uncharacterized membrane protein (UPF0127 family)
VVKNVTSGKVLSEDAEIAKNFWDKSFGMILTRNSPGVILKTAFGIHTFFMKSPIDVLILDKNKKIVKIKENLSPGRIMVWNPKFDTVVELKGGTVNKTKTKVSDLLDF